MALLNYTTKVSAVRTAAEIEACLAEHHATAILKEYDTDGFVCALSFKVETLRGVMPIRLPVDIEATLKVMVQQARARHIPKHLVNEAQARRVAWRILKDWVEAQMAILETEMVRLEQIFLPYIITPDGRTVYELFEQRQLQLTDGGKL